MAYEGFSASAERMKYSRNPPSHEYIGALPTEEQAELVGKAKKGDVRSRDRITEGLQRLVMGIAKSELSARGYNPTGNLLDDMLNEGQIGLLKSIDRYDPSIINPETGKPFAIPTYAGWWIRQEIGRALNSNYGRIMRIPSHELERMGKVKKTEARLSALSGRAPTISDIAAELKISEKEVERSYRLMKADMLSLDYNYGEENDMNLGNLLPDEKSSIESMYGGREISDAIQKALETAVESTTVKEGDVKFLKQYFGIGGDKQTHEEVANSFGISREGARWRIKDSLRKLSHNPEVRAILEGYAQH